jgi:TadE-like protein
MVTAETAAVLPVLALLLAFGLWAVSAVGAQVRCADAAREAARAAARGDNAASVRAAGVAAAPVGASVSVTGSADEVRVVVLARVGPLGRWLPSVTLTGSATAQVEPEAGG